MGKYKYKNPTTRGFEKLNKIESKEILNKFKIKRKWNEKLVLYKKGNVIYWENLTPIYVKALETLLTPVYLIVHIFISIIEVVKRLSQELFKLWFQRKTGSYTSRHINIKEVEEYL